MDVCMATWARSQPGLLLLTGAGMKSAEIRVEPPAGPPGPGMLEGTGWQAAPNQRWGESTPGVWGCVVVPVVTHSVRLGQTNRLVT